jgi:predicted TIM-barrel fold metal-dependent hydrolase
MVEWPRVIDADGHLLERQSDIRQYLAEPWKGRQTSFTPSDQPWDSDLYGTLGSRWYPRRGSPEEQVATWLKVMDEHNIETAVLFPTGAGNIAKLREIDFQIALARAANDHFAKEYNARSERIKAVGTLPMGDPRAAAEELRRAVTELGLISFEILSMGLPFGLGDPIYTPIWEAAHELGVPLCVHGNRQSSAEVGADRFRTFGEVHCYTFPAGLMLHFTSIMWNAIPLRYPGLKIAFLEIGATWLPYYLDRLDEHWEKRAKVEAPHLTERPSDVFRQSPIYVSLEAAESQLPATVAYVGDEHFVYASDIPHWDNEFPHNLEELWARPDLPRETKEKILYDNARALFGLGVPAGV